MSTSRPGTPASTSDLGVALTGELQRRGELCPVVHAGDPDAGAAARRLDEDGQAEPVPVVLGELVGGGPQDRSRRDRDARGAQDPLGEVLVHARRAGQDTAAHVRDAGELEHALDRPVLAVRSVQDRQDDLGAAHRFDAAREALQHGAGRTRRLRGHRPQGDVVDDGLSGVGAHHPVPRAGDADRHHLVAAAIEVLHHARRGTAGDVVLGVAPAKEHYNPGFGGHIEVSLQVRSRRLPNAGRARQSAPALQE